MSTSDKEWHEGVVRRSPRGNLWVAKLIVQSSTTGRILYLKTKPRFEHDRASRPDFPGGYVDDTGSRRGLAEEPQDTARREAIEETKFEEITAPLHLHTQVGARSTGGLPIDIEWFLSHISGEPVPTLNDHEHIDSWWDHAEHAPAIFGVSALAVGMQAIVTLHANRLRTGA